MNRRTRAGYTIIEILIVLLVVGILALLALPRLQNQKERATFASMESDLRNLATAEESYLFSKGTYTTDLVALQVTLSPGNVLVVNEATDAGWSATATHVPAVTKICYLFHGAATPVGSAVNEGVISCS